MQACDLEVIRDIPGFQVLMKVVLKNQIQRMVEQLAEYTGEESVILTASVSDGSLSHLGSESGKAFLETYDGIKPQFLGFCLKMHHQQQKPNKQEFEDSSPSDLRQKFGPGSTQHGTRPHKGYDSKSMRHDPYSVGQAKHPQYQSMIKQRNDLVVEQSKNNDSVASSIESSPLEKGMDDVFAKHIQQETMNLEMEAQSSGVEYASRLQEAIRIEMEAENETETSDEYSDAAEDDHQSSHYSGQDGAGQFETHGHKTVGTESGKMCSLASDSQDSRLNESEVVYDLKGEAEPEVSSNTTTSSDKDTSYNAQDISERSIKEELPAYSEVEQDDNSASGNVPLGDGNVPLSSGNIHSISGNIPSTSGNILSNTGSIPGIMPPASGNVPSASSDWMMNLHEMIGSIAAASGATSLGDTARKKPVVPLFNPSDPEAMVLPYSPPVALMKGLGCRYCHKVCSDKTKLTIHERIHTGEKPYSCEICGKGCTTKSNLKSHMRVHGQKEFICEICQKSFMSKSNLKSHLQTHLKALKNPNIKLD